mmetsp:Transcript_18186/g.34055  ORF Transcript_18186/g.34055 Transcript_18186/m.34055 type:complete len:134 (-) Transcript_18186:3723-4124(-)
MGGPGGVQIFPVECYLQKPSLREMQARDVLFYVAGSGEKLEDGYTLIDTGLVIACGQAMRRLVGLLQDPAVRHCTFHELSGPTQSSPATTNVTHLRLELYSDLLHALTLHNVSIALFAYVHALVCRAAYPLSS